MVPYIAISIILITLKVITGGKGCDEEIVTPMSYIKMLYQPEAGVFLWFIYALWWMYTIVPFFKTPKARLILFVFTFIMQNAPVSLPSALCLKEVQHFFFYFMLGVVCYDWKSLSSWIHKFPAFITYILFALCDTIILTNTYRGDFIYYITALTGIAASMSFAHSLEEPYKNSKEWIRNLGKSRYTIYLFHSLFMAIARAFVIKMPFLAEPMNIPSYAIIVSSGIIGPILLHKYVLCKTPVTRALFGLKNPQHTIPPL